MKYFVAESTMKDPLPATPQQMQEVFLPGHKANLAAGIAAGMLLMGGPSATGGFLILRAESREEIDTFLAADPFSVNGLATFRVTEFDPRDRADLVKDW